MGLPLLRGRDVMPTDFVPGTPRVAIVNEAMARHFFANADPIGRHFKWGRESFEIVGLVKDVHLTSTSDKNRVRLLSTVPPDRSQRSPVDDF